MFSQCYGPVLSFLRAPCLVSDVVEVQSRWLGVAGASSALLVVAPGVSFTSPHPATYSQRNNGSLLHIHDGSNEQIAAMWHWPALGRECRHQHHNALSVACPRHVCQHQEERMQWRRLSSPDTRLKFHP